MKHLFFFLCCLVALIFLSCSQGGDVLTSTDDTESNIQSILGSFRQMGASDSLVAGLETVFRDTASSNEEKGVAVQEAMINLRLEKLRELMESGSSEADSARVLYETLKDEGHPWGETK